jgi:serine/threonine protein kinase
MQPESRVREGDVLAGKYRVEKVLGSGGMGVVVAARHVQLDVLVALKFMADEAFEDPDLVARFLREARAAARLRSEHIARVTDVGTLESGAPYQVMEYLEGSDLAALLSREGPQPLASAVEYIVQACEALDEAHGAGIVHRDIKPSNLFLTKRRNGTPCIKVLDFGISKADRLSSSSAKLHGTHSRAVLGSPFYMSPEQMRAARQVDARADIWALGATLYELLTGHVPFEADSLFDLALRVAQSDPRPLRELRPEVPWALEQVVFRCLEKDRDDRFTGASVLASALAPFAVRSKVLLLGVVQRGAWSAAGSIESSGDAAARVVDAPVHTGMAAVRGREDSTFAQLNADKTLPMQMPAIESTATVGQRAARGWRTGARVSWGRSHRHLVLGGRAVWAVAAMGVFAISGGAAILITRSRESPRTVYESVPVRAGSAAREEDPVQASAAVPPLPALSGSSEPSSHIPTLSVTDLPVAAPPVFALSPKPAPGPQTVSPSPAHSSAVPSVLPSAQPPSQPTVSSAADHSSEPLVDPLANPK